MPHTCSARVANSPTSWELATCRALLALAGFVSNVLLLGAVMLFLFGRAHPPVWDDTAPLEGPQYFLVVIGVILLALTFVPQPMMFIGG